jgi:predicted metal-dependent peptidase
MVNISDQLAKASKTLILEEPFYGLFLVGLNKTFRNDIPTAGVSKHGIGVQLAVNPEFFEGLSLEHRIGLLKHELLHISFGHLLVRDLYSNKKLFNIAADLEINQYIASDYLPEGGLTLNSFPELNLPVKAGTKEYYEILEKAQEDGTSPSLDSLLNQMDGDSQYDHKTWEEIDELTEADKKLIEKQIEHQLKEVADQTEKRCGNIPGELADLISRLRHVEPPKFDWRGYLRRFVGNSSIVYTKKLRRKYNKRYIENPGLKIKFKNNVLVGIDTSGSVSRDELKEFVNELVHMHKTGNMITIAQCDTQLNSVTEFNPKKDLEIQGRGGTSFQPVIDHFNENKGKYTALIYLTDGEAWNPENCPKNTLWVLSSKSQMNDNLPGKVIQLN